MGKKCYKSSPPCKVCPKLRKKKKKADTADGICPHRAADQPVPHRVPYLAPLPLIFISGHRGCTANSPAGLA